MLLDKAEAGSEEFSDLNEILDCAHRAEDLMAKICMYSGRIESDKKTCDLVDVVTGALKSIRENQPKAVKIEDQIWDEKMPVFVDAAQVEKILAHLCTNAIQAVGDTGDIKISLEPAMLEAFECFDGSTLSGGTRQIDGDRQWGWNAPVNPGTDIRSVFYDAYTGYGARIVRRNWTCAMPCGWH